MDASAFVDTSFAAMDSLALAGAGGLQWISLFLTLIFALGRMLAIYMLGRWRARVVCSNVIRYLITLAFPFAAMLVPWYWDFLAFGEKVNVQVMEPFETEQIPFARPFLTFHKAKPICG